MIKSITVINDIGESLKLELSSPEKTGFIVKDIDGLGPVKATVNFSEFASGDGSTFSKARVSTRNIVLALAFMEIPYLKLKADGTYVRATKTVEDIRHLSYKYFGLKRKVALVIETSNLKVLTEGYVETNNSDIFSNAVGTQISILCPDPYFRKELLQTTDATYSGNVGTINVDYEGFVKTGLTLSISGATGPLESIDFENLDFPEKLRFYFGNLVVGGQKILITTGTGNKNAYMELTPPYTYNFVPFLSSTSTGWPQIRVGLNRFKVTTVGVTGMSAKIENYILYEGV